MLRTLSAAGVTLMTMCMTTSFDSVLSAGSYVMIWIIVVYSNQPPATVAPIVNAVASDLGAALCSGSGSGSTSWRGDPVLCPRPTAVCQPNRMSQSFVVRVGGFSPVTTP